MAAYSIAAGCEQAHSYAVEARPNLDLFEAAAGTARRALEEIDALGRLARPADPASVARRFYAERRRRDRRLPPELLGEPAWDLLLTLFIARHDDRKIDLTQAGVAAGVSATALRRLLARMEGVDLILCRRPQRQRAIVDLTDSGFLRMTLLLVELG